jgi:hypothetical protein
VAADDEVVAAAGQVSFGCFQVAVTLEYCVVALAVFAVEPNPVAT